MLFCYLLQFGVLQQVLRVLLGPRSGRRAQRTEGRPQLTDQAGEPGLVLVPLPLTLSLNNT